ncbi:hypothetical protein HPB48_000964 [Haemaphysalis longicornis]|uniref:Uncharacterized protein n=1 Tax=Haemaphysalis longicornis TaxID=44386 RepID=A0A9J6GU53_HAELO|nr:hypothetical protein HPB48_000964 [Haemaphysalis longicornis]
MQENTLLRVNMQKLVAENASMMSAIQKLMAEIESLKQRVTANAANTVEMTEQPVPVVEDEEDISDDAPVNDRPAPKKRAVPESSFKQQIRDAIHELRAPVQESKTEIQILKAESARHPRKPTQRTTDMAADPPKLMVWQWNCRGFRNKKASVEQFIKSRRKTPDAIIPQELMDDARTLPGYKSHASAR